MDKAKLIEFVCPYHASLIYQLKHVQNLRVFSIGKNYNEFSACKI